MERGLDYVAKDRLAKTLEACSVQYSLVRVNSRLEMSEITHRVTRVAHILPRSC